MRNVGSGFDAKKAKKGNFSLANNMPQQKIDIILNGIFTELCSTTYYYRGWIRIHIRGVLWILIQLKPVSDPGTGPALLYSIVRWSVEIFFDRSKQVN